MSVLTRKTSSDGSDALRRAAEDYEILHENIARLERKCTDFGSTNERLLQEVGLLRERNGDLQRERDLLQAYAVTMNTKLDLVVDVVRGVQEDAMRSPARPQEIAPPKVDAAAVAAVELELGRPSSARMPRIGIAG